MDVQLHRLFHLSRNQSEGSSNNKRLPLMGSEYNFCLSWILTWFAHVLTNFTDLSRLWDCVIASHPAFILYFTASILIDHREAVVDICREYTVVADPCEAKHCNLDFMSTDIHAHFQNIDWSCLELENLISTAQGMMLKFSPEDLISEGRLEAHPVTLPSFSPLYHYPHDWVKYNVPLRIVVPSIGASTSQRAEGHQLEVLKRSNYTRRHSQIYRLTSGVSSSSEICIPPMYRYTNRQTHLFVNLTSSLCSCILFPKNGLKWMRQHSRVPLHVGVAYIIAAVVASMALFQNQKYLKHFVHDLSIFQW